MMATGWRAEALAARSTRLAIWLSWLAMTVVSRAPSAVRAATS